METSFYNTTHSEGRELREFTAAATKQEEAIADYFKAREYRSFTPSQVQKTVRFRHVPITSVRRAITSLTKRGMLEKTREQEIGPFGRPEYRWRAVRPRYPLQGLLL